MVFDFKKAQKTIIFSITMLLFVIAFCGCAAPQSVETVDEVIENPGITISQEIAGTWYYVKSTEREGDDERLLSPREVEILHEFRVSPPRLEIREDSTIFADFSAFEIWAELTQTDTYSFDIITEESKNKNEAVYDFIVFDPDSGLLRYTWNIADINHYFSREKPAAMPLPPAPDIQGVTWLVPPTFEYEEVLYCPFHGFLALGGYWIDEKTGEETGESCGHGVGWTAFLYDAHKNLFGADSSNEQDSSFEFYSKEEFEAEYYVYMDNVNPFYGFDDDAYNDKIAIAYGCDFITDFIYDKAEHWRRLNDIIAVAIEDKWGILDKEGNIAVPFVFDHAISIDNTTAFAKYEGLYGIISLTQN